MLTRYQNLIKLEYSGYVLKVITVKTNEIENNNCPSS